MSKKMRFKFNPDTGLMEATCNLEEGTHLAACPMVKFYNAGIGTNVIVDIKKTDTITVQFANLVDVKTAKNLCGVGEYFCKSCVHNEINCKKR